MTKKEFSTEIGGKTLTATFTNLADQANSSLIIKRGNTSVLVTAVMSKNEKEIDYFPLVVDYEEKFYAAGRILGGRFMKREGRPSDEAVLSGRMIDRTIRPLFNQAMRREVQIVATVLSIDEENDPGTISIIGASLALATSDIPWNGPVSAVRVGTDNGSDELTLNPSYSEIESRTLDLLVCGKDGNINMIEAGAKEVANDKLNEAMNLAVAEIEKLQTWQKEIVAEIGQQKQEVVIPTITDEAKALFEKEIAPKLGDAIFSGEKKTIYDLEEEWLAKLKEELPEEKAGLAQDYYNHQADIVMHEGGLKENRRADGRAMDEIRPLYAQAGDLSEILHGTGIFYRGGTHVLSVLTLGGPKDAQLIEGMEVRGAKRFMHHYNFPPFSVGEVGRMGGMNRRAIGHGALAEKALQATLPTEEEFPYTIRIVSESTASNGSTSQASICASTLALMDAGVPIKRPTAGIAMGLLLDEKDPANYKIMTDIQGPEDHHGDMDFKVAGTREGVTAIQMDIKVDGVPPAILSEALKQAEKARLQILDVIEEAIPAPRPELKPNAPRVLTHKIDEDQIGMLIGSGGKTIKGLAEKYSAEIEVNDDGKVTILGQNKDAADLLEEVIQMFRIPEPGEEFDGEIVKVLDFGFFVNVGGNKEGLVHVSEIAPYRVSDVEKHFKRGAIVPVVLKEVDEKGRLNFSIKERDPEWAKNNNIPEATGAPSGGKPPFKK